MLRRYGEGYVAELGSRARARDRKRTTRPQMAVTSTRTTTRGAILGTPATCSLRADPRLDVSRTSDGYALGAILFGDPRREELPSAGEAALSDHAQHRRRRRRSAPRFAHPSRARRCLLRRARGYIQRSGPTCARARGPRGGCRRTSTATATSSDRASLAAPRTAALALVASTGDTDGLARHRDPPRRARARARSRGRPTRRARHQIDGSRRSACRRISSQLQDEDRRNDTRSARRGLCESRGPCSASGP